MSAMVESGNKMMAWKGISDNPCNLCPRECMADRDGGQKGYCLMDNRIQVARAALHRWEEPCISGKTGSGTVFFSGCNLRCVYCQNYEISGGQNGKTVSETELVDIFIDLQKQGAANINLVTPDHYIAAVARAVIRAKERGLVIPIVYNGSGYEKKEVIGNLSGIVDIFLTDFKYMDRVLAGWLSAAPDYPEIAREALDEMVKITGSPVFDENGMMKRGVIVRHLLLPGHKRNAKDVIRYVHETYGKQVILSLMNQYTPLERLKENPDFSVLCRKVTKREYEQVVDYAIEIGVEDAFIQEGDTAKESYIPKFWTNNDCSE